MKAEAVFDFMICNDGICPVKETSCFEKITKPAIYEVIKLKNGVPLFFGDHMERMRQSADMLNTSIEKDNQEIKDKIADLSEKNNCLDNNVKLLWSKTTDKTLFLIYFIPTEYPSDKEYLHGIHTILFNGTRKNPHIKTQNTSFREEILKKRQKVNAYEALLVDENGYITEGSRSNFFFMEKKMICTPPSEAALLGVTRKKILEICHMLKIDVIEKALELERLNQIEGAFITGTTVDVLAIGSIEDKKLDSLANPVIKKINDKYKRMATDYISTNML
ncbi:aminotransferase class IV [Desulfobacterales bacterium HSG16]|nr:aminotransferase class IV [Desulfobacterales bacterium HSG16]